MKSRNLILVRHGQSEWNAKNLFTGWKDPGLTDQGVSEAKNAGKLILEQNIEFDVMYTSMLSRAQKTGDIILGILNHKEIPIIKNEALNERHYGSLAGLNKDDARKKWGDELVHNIASILGIEAGAAMPIRPVVHCSARESDRINSTHYQGVPTCGEAQMVSGAMGCPYGCFGYGDCEAVCEFDAIHIVAGLATVDYHKCVGCGACEKACPRQLIEMLALREDPMLVIACATMDKAKDVRSYCKVGCMGCGLCVKMAPNMFQMRNNLAVIDYEKYGNKEDRDKATGKCPRSMMVYVGKNAVVETVDNAAAAQA